MTTALGREEIDFAIILYEVKLIALADRYAAGARSIILNKAQKCADALICLLVMAPLDKRSKIDRLIDQFEGLRIACLKSNRFTVGPAPRWH